ncbi:MAG: HNH endonuclease, partial [Acidimicrobiia bacterium]|nr:HNH endonuclease [Acidimicrobiia bacterium]
RGIQVHHIVHWEDGGPTDTDNLCCLCRRHHRMLHNGLIGITGHADDPDGLTVTDRWNRRLDPTGKPTPPNRSPAEAARAAHIPTPTYRHPSGERINTRDTWFGAATAA